MRSTHTALQSCLDSVEVIGESKRFSPCPVCNRGKSAFLVTRKQKGWVYWCHRCHAKGFRPADGYTPKQALRLAAPPEKALTFVSKVELPSDFTQELPTEAKQWLYSYALEDKDILEYSIGYSASLHRVILPVFKDGQLVYWQGRALESEKELKRPKYVNVQSSTNKPLMHLEVDATKPTVLVEDILSAIKVAKAGYNSLGLLGSYIDDATIIFMLKKSIAQSIVWLDPDKRREMIKYQKRLQTFGISTKCIPLTERDPKDYSSSEIHSIIEGA